MSDTVSKRIGESISRLLGADYDAEAVDESAGGKAQRERLNQRLVALEMRRQANIEAVVAMAYAVAGDDAIEGPRAFAEKRRPRWQGR